jgi:membrane-bound ClpP family serine protease
MQNIKNKLITLLQLILVIIFIIFEELVWEGIAKPIYEWVHSLKILVKLQHVLNKLPSWMILILFVVLLISVESFGFVAGALFLSGHILLGIGLYSIKIPIAAFTFWMFKVTDDKLMQYEWFAWLYNKTMACIEWMKSLDIYQSTMKKLKELKQKLKDIKAQYFASSSPFILRTKKLYSSIKSTLKKFKNG